MTFTAQAHSGHTPRALPQEALAMTSHAPALDQILEMPDIRRVQEMLADRRDAVVTVGDVEGRLLWASEAGSTDLFGRIPATFTGHNRFDYVHPDDVEHARRGFERAAARETVEYVIRARTAEDEWKWISTVAWGVEGPQGRVVVAITVPVKPPWATR